MQTHIETVKRYFHEAIDGAKPELVRELFTADCQIHRPEMELRGVDAMTRLIGLASNIYRDFRSEIHHIVASGDLVAVRLTHRGISRSNFLSRTGIYDVANKPIEWTAMAMFRFEGDRIAEEWVNRDELGMLLYYNILSSSEEAAVRLQEMVTR